MALYETAQQHIAARRELRKAHEQEALRLAERDSAFARARRDRQALAPLAARGERVSDYAEACARYDARRRELGLEPLPPACPRCGDTGFFRGAPCVCLKQEVCALIEAQTLSAWTPESFAETRFDLFGQEREAFFAKVYREAEQIAAHPDGLDKCTFVYCGKTGTGKSHLAKCLAAALRENGRTVLFFSAYAFFDLLGGLFKNEEKRLISGLLASCDGLFVDDLGTEACGDYARNVFTSLLSTRCEKNLLTVFTTNLVPADLQKVYGERILSRLADRRHAKVYLFEGRDVRLRSPQT